MTAQSVSCAARSTATSTHEGQTAAVRWICSLREAGRVPKRGPINNAGFLLEPCAPWLLRSGQIEGADRGRDAEADRLSLKIEERVRGKSAADRQALRQAESKLLVADLRVWFDMQIGKLPPRGPTAEAIRYALNHWDGLERFLEDGRIELDTNSAERAMRPVALSRNVALPQGECYRPKVIASSRMLLATLPRA